MEERILGKNIQVALLKKTLESHIIVMLNWK